MDRFIALVMLFFSAPVLAASSTVVYPGFKGLGYSGASPTSDGLVWNGSVAKKGATVLPDGTIRFPYGGKLFAGLDAAKAKAVGAAIMAKAPVVQSTAKILASQTLKNVALGGIVVILGAWARERGLQYANGKWEKNVQANPNYSYGSENWDIHDQSFGSNFCQARSGGRPISGVMGPMSDHGGTYQLCKYMGPNDPWEKFYLSPPTQATKRDAVDADFDELSTARDLTHSEIQELIDAGWIAPISGPTTVIGDLSGLTAEELAGLQDVGFFQPTPGVGALPVGDPVTDPVTGQKTQPHVQLDPAPNAGVRVTPYEAPLNPDGTPATDPQGNPLPNQERNPDPCELDPERAGCSKLGDLDGEPPVPTQLNVSLNPMAGWDAPGACPADVVIDAMGQQIPFKFKGACDFFTMMRPVILAGAWIVATLIFVGGVRT